MTTNESAPPLTVLYDGGCPLCRREIAHVKGLAQRQGDNALCFLDISAGGDGYATYAADRATLLARFHVQQADGSRLDGARAFVAMWSRLPGWRWLARLARLPGMLTVLEIAYRGFLLVRPSLQSLAHRLEPSPRGIDPITDPTPALHLSQYWVRELRSDHAGETGAVCIYRGIAAVARWRGDPQLLAFAARHGDAEAEHLQLVEAWLPAAQRSRLLGPWRLAGWLTGALPALAGRRAVYATIAAVETFVDQHYQQQIDPLTRDGGPEGLLPLLVRCQADERHHRDEAAALAGTPLPWVLRAWCAVVGAGSAVAVVLARRV
jgi:demethoxyubiquinone hydroxylase (CLK1/Coq7/Cat5 family)/predicted DCC family thiol-disulfide oxidoreductase YuxK